MSHTCFTQIPMGDSEMEETVMLEMLFMNCPADTAASTKLGPTPCSTSAHRHCQGCFYDKVRPRHADGLLHLALRRAPPHPTATTPRAHSERRMQRSPSHSLRASTAAQSRSAGTTLSSLSSLPTIVAPCLAPNPNRE